MDAYASTLQGAAAASPGRTAGMLIASTARRAHVDAFTVSFDAAPADNSILVTVQRFTVSGTATAIAAAPKDPASPAASCTTEENASVEPTYTAATQLFMQGMNQRSVLRIVYAPQKELMTNVTTDNGIGWNALHASATPTADVTTEWVE